MTISANVAVLLDEMMPPVVADALRARGLDVVAVVQEPTMRAMTDTDLFAWAAAQGRTTVTENVRDFRPILAAAAEAGRPIAPLLLTSNRTFPRSRRNPGPLIDALTAWLSEPGNSRVAIEQWL